MYAEGPGLHQLKRCSGQPGTLNTKTSSVQDRGRTAIAGGEADGGIRSFRFLLEAVSLVPNFVGLKHWQGLGLGGIVNPKPPSLELQTPARLLHP